MRTISLRRTARAVRTRLDGRLSSERANFWCHVVEGAFASFGGELVGQAVVFTVLAERVGMMPATLGFLSSLGSFTFLAPLLFAARVEAARRKKRLVLLLGIGQRAPLAITVALLLLLARSRPLECLVAIALANLGGAFAVSVLVAPWVDLIAETVHPDLHGRVFGYRGAITAALSLAAGPAAGLMLRAVGFPANYALLHAAAFASTMVSWILFALVDEVPEHVVPKRPARTMHYFRDLAKVLRNDRNYRWLLVHHAVSRIGGAASVYYAWVWRRDHGGAEGFVVGAWITAVSLARVLGNMAFSRLVDQTGHKRMMNLGAGFGAAAGVAAAFAPSGRWFVGVALLMGLSTAAGAVGGMPFQMRVAPRGRRIGYQALSGAILAPIGMVVGPATGFVLGRAGYFYPFMAGAALILAAQLALERCTPPPLPQEAGGGAARRGTAEEDRRE